MKILKIVLQVTFVSVTALAFSACGTDVLTYSDSPDKTKTLFLYTKRIGDENTYLALEEGKTGKETKILKIEGIVPVDMTWRNEKEVVVVIPEEHKVEYLRETAMGVKFEFRRR